MKEILDESGMRRSLIRITHEILERNKGVENLVLVGIETRGATLAKRLQANIEKFEGINIPCISLNIAPWRDDHKKAQLKTTQNYDLKDKKIVLVDDVLFRGRTIRAAMEAVLSYGRAKEIQLAVLVDRGHRELPIRADFVGKNIPSSLQEIVRVKTFEDDGKDGIYIYRGEKHEK